MKHVVTYIGPDGLIHKAKLNENEIAEMEMMPETYDILDIQ